MIRRTIRIGYLLVGLVVLASTAAPAQTVEYYHLDALGSVRAVTNDAGAVIERHDYQPFGEEISPPGGANPRQFTGKERDAETGLDYFGARYYSGKRARFTTVDPFLDASAALTNPQRWNRYAYGLNNPLRNVDPDGRDTVDLAIGFVQGIGKSAVGVVTGLYALATNPRAVASAMAQDVRLLRYGLANPGEVLDTYVSLSTSANDADQRALGAAIGQGAPAAALALGPGVRAATTTQVVHFTDAAGRASINASGSLRAGGFVTKAGDVRGMTAAQIESRLEIQSGRGQHSFRTRVPNRNLAVPANGATTSGGAWQRQLKESTPIKKE